MVETDPAVQEGEIARGRELFTRNGCALCHGVEGRGDGSIAATLNPRPRDFRDLSAYKQGHNFEDILQTMEKGMVSGRSVMPAYPHIPLDQRQLIARYITALQAESAAEGLSIEDPWIRETLPPHKTGAGYMAINNPAFSEDLLTGVEADGVGKVEIHLMIREGEAMKMRKVDQLTIPGQGHVELQPGGMHLMLVDLAKKLKVGDKVKLTLHFKNAGSRAIEALVRPLEQ